ncbi:hypothetical protein [Paenibacillus vini]|uniref:Uncharacterized protein n=1 Tax=Paenibacillus vini TaxID=1476024 RepID=A0ABQ4MJ75_9BACL|nr:hypothetical protein [Paenibacillus vini]GIP56043.1 hypothetical protein J42TS3_50780 [Paenibacillus vini]
MTISKIIAICMISIVLASCSRPQDKPPAASGDQPTLESSAVQSFSGNKAKQNDFLTINKRLDKDIYPMDSLLVGDQLWYVEEEGIYSYQLNTNELRNEIETKGFNEIRAFNNNIWFYFQQLEGSDDNNLSKPLVRYDTKNEKFISYSEKDLRLGSSLTLYSDEHTAWIGSDSGSISIDLTTNKVKNRYELDEVTSINGNQRMVYFGKRDGSIHTYDKVAHQFGQLQTTEQLQGAQIEELRWFNGKLMVIWGDSDENTGVSLFDETSKSWEEFVQQDASGYVWSDQISSFQMGLLTEDKGEQLVNYSWIESSESLEKIYKTSFVVIEDIATINNRYALISAFEEGVNVLDKSTGEIIWKSADIDSGTLHKVRDSEYIMISSKGIYDILINIDFDDIDSEIIENEGDPAGITMSNYSNVKYGFEIDYPSSWNISEESLAGDGVYLYEEDGNDIRTYGGYYPLGDGIDTSEIDEAKEAGIQVEEIETLQGIKGYVFKEKDSGDNAVMHYIVYGSEIRVQLYAAVTSTFYSKNRELLLEMAKSIYITD